MAAGDNNRGVDISLRGKTEEERRENCRRGAYAAAEAKRKKKSMQQAIQMVLDSNLKNISKMKDADKIKADLIALGCPDDDLTFNSAIAIRAAAQAAHGDMEAARFVRDTSGQAPTSKVAVGSVQDFDDLDLSRLSKEELLKLAAEADE